MSFWELRNVHEGDIQHVTRNNTSKIESYMLSKIVMILYRASFKKGHYLSILFHFLKLVRLNYGQVLVVFATSMTAE